MEDLEDYLDEDGYPTDKVLDLFMSYEFKCKADVDRFLEILEGVWYSGSDGYKRIKTEFDDLLMLHTFGWSGNEEVIVALQNNFIFWGIAFNAHFTGGHYYLNIKRLLATYLS